MTLPRELLAHRSIPLMVDRVASIRFPTIDAMETQHVT
jgi:hypothetical protein